MRKRGRQLKAGDHIKVWWKPHVDKIIELRPYRGPLEYLWAKEGGARIATFAINKTGMTIGPEEVYETV